MTTTDFSRHLTKFLCDYLPSQRNVSANTVKSYRDTFMLLLRYCREHQNLVLEQLQITQLDAPLITDFLLHLETERHCSIATRNQRLAAIHAFFHYLQTEQPEYLMHCQRILAIPSKRRDRPEVGYLSAEDLAAILAQPDLSTPAGRRDAVLLSVLYDTGARVQEVIDLAIRDVRLESPALIRLTGKGGKMRNVPLMERTVSLLKNFFQEHDYRSSPQGCEPVFRNRDGKPLSRSGVRYILNKYVKQARAVHPTLRDDISPHMLRHTKAMHLLQGGNPLVVIRNILGHTDVKTTEIYARADMEMKRRALASISDNLPKLKIPSWLKTPDLLDWLRRL